MGIFLNCFVIMMAGHSSIMPLPNINTKHNFTYRSLQTNNLEFPSIASYSGSVLSLFSFSAANNSLYFVTTQDEIPEDQFIPWPEQEGSTWLLLGSCTMFVHEILNSSNINRGYWTMSNCNYYFNKNL